MANREIVNSLQESKNEITNEMVLQIKNNYLMPLASRIENLIKIIEAIHNTKPQNTCKHTNSC